MITTPSDRQPIPGPSPSVAKRLPRVLFYDYWTKGIEKFARVFRFLPQAADYHLLHLGSFRDRSVPKAEVVSGIRCTDISSFPGMTLAAVLQTLQPDVVVGLNVTHIFDRAILLTCRKLDIPTLFLQHGAWLERETIERWHSTQQRNYALKDYLRRVPGMARMIPWYLQARVGLPRPATPYRVLRHMITNPALAHGVPTAADELWPTRALVFSPKDADILSDTHGMPDERIEIIGNPESDHVVARRERPLDPATRTRMLAQLGLDPARPVVTYMDEGLVEHQQFLGWTPSARLVFLEELREVCSSLDAQLLVRPHPGSDYGAVIEHFRTKTSMAIDRTLTLVDSVDLAVAVLGSVTTALEPALILGKPILSPLWHLRGDASLSAYVTYGASVPARSTTELKELLSAVFAGSPLPCDTTAFTQRRFGPVDGHATARVAAAILGLAGQHLAKEEMERHS